MKYEHIKNYKEEDFRQVTGVRKGTFVAMLDVVSAEYSKLHKEKHGRNRKLLIEDNLLMMLEYYKEYRTFQCIGASYGLSKSSARKVIMWIENILIKSGQFSLPSKRKLAQSNIEYEVIVVDSTETPIERPKNKQRKHYSGKKTSHNKNADSYRPKK